MTNVLQHIANYTGGEFYMAKTAEDIVDIYSNMMLLLGADMTTDTDGDGIADTFETAGMRLSNGEIIYTDPLNWDTDGDGIRDGDEIVMGGFGSIHAVLNEDGSYTFTSDYGITFYMKSNPTMSDSDEDGYNDKVDPRPLKCDVFKYALKNEQYVKTLNQNNDLLYGGNQNSIQYKNIPNGGCGVIAAADTLIYLKQQGNIDTQQASTRRQRDPYRCDWNGSGAQTRSRVQLKAGFEPRVYGSSDRGIRKSCIPHE